MGLKLNGDYLSGSFRTLNAVSGSFGVIAGGPLSPRSRIIGNRIAFGLDASWPRGYNSEHAIIMPQRTGGFIACIIRGEGGVAAQATAVGNMAATIAGSGSLAAAGNMAANVGASIAGSGSLTASPSAKGWLRAAMDAGARPSAFDIAQEVWQSKAASYDTPATMGAKVNAAGSSGDPWAAVIESGMTAGDVLRIITAVLAGKTTIVDLGGGTATVTFKSLDGSKARVTAALTGSERTNVTLDGS